MYPGKQSPIIVRHAGQRALLLPKLWISKFWISHGQAPGLVNTGTTVCQKKMPAHETSDGLITSRTLLDDKGHNGDSCSA